MSRAALAILLLATCSCAARPSRDTVLQTAIDAGKLACQTALADPRTQWGPGAKGYCQMVATGKCAEP